MAKELPRFWTHGRRERLLKDVLAKVPEYPRATEKYRNFEEEASNQLPKLKTEIERHNKKLCRERDKLFEKNKELRRILIAKTRWGSEADCEEIVAEYITPEMKQEPAHGA